ncbi:MAG: DctP family TRAP transporter solute-binding subunit [Rhodocyclaceae bacterium]
MRFTTSGFGKSVLAALLGSAMFLSCVAQAQVTARLGHSFTEDHPRGKAMKKFAADLEKATAGKIKVRILGGSMLGSEQQMLQATQSGAQEFYLGAVSPISGRIIEMNIFDFPFLFANDEEAFKVLDGQFGRKMLDDLAPLNLQGLTWSGGAFRSIANNKRAVHSLADLKGLKIRVMQTKVAIESFKALGMNPVPMSYSEVYTALETGALDGHEHPLVDMYQNKMFEVEKFLTLSNHVYTPVALIVSKKWFNSLPADQQAAIRKVAEQTRDYERQEELRQERDAVAQLKSAGMTVTELSAADRDRIRTLVKPVIDANAKAIGADFVKSFYDEVEKVRAKP